VVFHVDSAGEVREGPVGEPEPVGSARAVVMAAQCASRHTDAYDRLVAAVLTRPDERRRRVQGCRPDGEGPMALPPACLIVLTRRRLVVHRLAGWPNPRPRDLVYELPRSIFVRGEGPVADPGRSGYRSALFRADGVALAWCSPDSELHGCRELVRQIDPSS
jgi:hypothetical protein